MNITEKLKGIMSEDEIAKFEASVQTLINEQVEAKVATEIESIKAKYDAVAEEYCKKMIAEGVESAKQTLIGEYDGKILDIEDKVIKGFDLFLEQEIIPQISDDTITKIAINEAFAPIVTGIKRVFEENYVALDSEGTALLSEAKKEISRLNETLSESISEKMELNERLEKVATHLLMSESTNGLNVDQKKRVSEMFKDKPFEEVEKKIGGFVQFLCESEVKRTAKPAEKDSTKPAPASKDGVILENAIGDTSEPKAAPETKTPETSESSVIDRADFFMK